jgi:hypothetical protein
MAGYYGTASNKLWIGNADYGSLALAQRKSPIYGNMGADSSTTDIRINGTLQVCQDTIIVQRNYQTFTSTPSFVRNTICNPYTVSGDITIVPNMTGAIPGTTVTVRLIGNGTNNVNFGTCVKANGTWNNTNGKVNLVIFLYDGVDVWYSLTVHP